MDIRATMETALLRPAGGGRAGVHLPGGRRTVHMVAVAALTTVVAAGYSAVALGLYHTFRTSSYDLVIFDQAVRSYAHFRPGISIIKGIHNGFGPAFSFLGHHCPPAIASLPPLSSPLNIPCPLLVAH